MTNATGPVSSRRSILATVLASVILAAIALSVGGRVAKEMVDLEVYWTAAGRAAAGEPLYREADGHYQFKYLPAFAILTIPLSALPWPTARVAWFALSATLLPVLVALSIAILPVRRRPVWWLAGGAVVVLAKFFGHELVLGQVNVLFGVIALLALAALRASRETMGGVLLSAAIVIKPYAVLFLPWLLARGRRASIVAAAASCAVVLALPAVLYGLGGAMELHLDWWRTVTASTAPNLTNNDNVSIAALFAKWMGIGRPAAILAAAVSVGLLALVVMVYRRRGGVAAPEALEAALLLTCIPLLSPQGWDYVFLISAPAIVLLLNYEDRLPRALRAATLISFLVIGLSLYDLMGRDAYGRFMSWSVITLCYLVVVAALAVLRARKVA